MDSRQANQQQLKKLFFRATALAHIVPIKITNYRNLMIEPRTCKPLTAPKQPHATVANKFKYLTSHRATVLSVSNKVLNNNAKS